MAENRLNEKARTKGRMAIYALAGVYLLYMAYCMFRELPYSAGSEKILMIVFSILFTLIGGGMVIMALYKGYKLSKETTDAMRKIEEEKKASLEEEKEASTEEEKESE